MDYAKIRMLQIDPPDTRKRGTPKRRFIDAMSGNMGVACVSGDAQDRVRWRRVILCGNL